MLQAASSEAAGASTGVTSANAYTTAGEPHCARADNAGNTAGLPDDEMSRQPVLGQHTHCVASTLNTPHVFERTRTLSSDGIEHYCMQSPQGGMHIALED